MLDKIRTEFAKKSHPYRLLLYSEIYKHPETDTDIVYYHVYPDNWVGRKLACAFSEYCLTHDKVCTFDINYEHVTVQREYNVQDFHSWRMWRRVGVVFEQFPNKPFRFPPYQAKKPKKIRTSFAQWAIPHNVLEYNTVEPETARYVHQFDGNKYVGMWEFCSLHQKRCAFRQRRHVTLVPVPRAVWGD